MPTLVERIVEMREYRSRIYGVRGDGVDVLLGDTKDALDAAERRINELEEGLGQILHVGTTAGYSKAVCAQIARTLLRKGKEK